MNTIDWILLTLGAATIAVVATVLYQATMPPRCRVCKSTCDDSITATHPCCHKVDVCGVCCRCDAAASCAAAEGSDAVLR